MSANGYRCPLTAQVYPQGTKVSFHVNGERGKNRLGIIMQSGTGDWKIIAKSTAKKGRGEIFPIAATGRAASPQSIRKAP